MQQVNEHIIIDETAERIKQNYNQQKAVDRYAGYYQNSARLRRKDRREKHAIAQALSLVPQGALILDLPCGAGRLYPFLKKLGYNVVSADSSAYMVDYARRQAENLNPNIRQKDAFQVTDIFHTEFADKQFEAVVCNRLLHHFLEPTTRQKALRELARISAGPIVVSFFSNVAADALKYYYKKHLKRQRITDRIPISPWQFAHDIDMSGLEIQRWILPRPMFSMQWYVQLKAL